MMKKEGKKNPLQSFYICVSLWNRLEVYVLPKLICWQLMPKVRNEEVGTLGMISHEDRALMDGIGAYIKEIQEKMDLPLENTRKNLLLQLENTRRNLPSRRWPSPTMLAPCSWPSQAPELWEMNYSHSVYNILWYQPEWAMTDIKKLIVIRIKPNTHITFHLFLYISLKSMRLMIFYIRYMMDFPGEESACQCRRHRFNPWVGKIPWRRKWQLIPVFLPGKSHGQRSLVGYSPWGCKEADMT